MYHHVPSRQLPIHFCTHFCCRMCHLATKCSKILNCLNYCTMSNTANQVDNASGLLCSQWHSVRTESTPSEIEVGLLIICQLSSEEGHQLSSADSRTCVVRRSYGNFGDRCFVAASPRLWNSRPAGLRQTTLVMNSLMVAKYLFVWVLRSRCIVTICLNCASPNFFTYLLAMPT